MKEEILKSLLKHGKARSNCDRLPTYIRKPILCQELQSFAKVGIYLIMDSRFHGNDIIVSLRNSAKGFRRRVQA